jgi:hypothetical protein
MTHASSGRSLANPVALINKGGPFLKTADAELRKNETVITLMVGCDDSETLVRVCEAQQKAFAVSGMTRTKTLLSLSASSSSSTESGYSLQEGFSKLHENFPTFGMDLRRATDGSPEAPTFDSLLRRTMEPHLRKARLLREKSRSGSMVGVPSAIASSVGVPYTRLRRENPFLYDIHTHPLHEILAETLGVDDLSKLHEAGDLRDIFSPFLSRTQRRPFHAAYDNFVTSFCIPLLHSMAMSQNLFHGAVSRISYRYQAFPKIRIVRPGDASRGPECGTSSGLSIGYLHFHVPLTAAMGTNALYTESHPGKENWHPLITKSIGLGFLFDGARCLHFNMENTTETTSVALDFVIAIYNDRMDIDDHVDGETLCNGFILEDQFSEQGFYDEAMIDLKSLQRQLVAKKRGDRLLDPSEFVGFPCSFEN